MKKLMFFLTIVALNTHIVMGQECVYCTAPPIGTKASNIGENSSATALHAIAIGENSSATALHAIAIGQNSAANENYSIAIGGGAEANGVGSIALGSNSQTSVTGGNSIAIGTKVESAAGLSMVIGVGPTSIPDARLRNNIQESLMIGFDSYNPTLFVSSPYESSYLKNTTGRIAIGNVRGDDDRMAPQAKLHLRSDDGENATVFIEPNNWAAGEKAMLALGSLNYGISSDLTSGFAFKSSANYRFINGKVGIGAFNFNPPEAKLHIKCIQDEDADIFLEPYMTENIGERGGDWQASIYLGTRGHGIAATAEEGVVFSTEKDFIFNQGTVKMRGLQLYTGPTTQPGSILVCTDPEGNAVWQDPSTMIIPSLWAENNNEDIYRMSKVGIGTENPHSTLELSKNLENGGTVGLGITNQNEGTWFIGIHKDFCNGTDLVFGDYQNMISNDPSLVLKKNGSVGIGTLETLGYKLAVNGEIIATEVMIKLYDEWPWPDYVFDESYQLMSLGQLNEFIKENNHLPGVPTQAEVKNEGVAVGEMEGILLEKIEELTLYIIAQQEQLEALTGEVERLKQQ